MSKKQPEKTLKEKITDLVDDKIPCILDDIINNTELTVEARASLLGLANTALHHMRLLLARLE